MTYVDSVNWVDLAARTPLPTGLFVGGEVRPAISGATRPVVAPRDGSTLVELAWADEADADAAVAAARQAFDHGPWPRMQPRERGEILQRFATVVEEHRDGWRC